MKMPVNFLMILAAAVISSSALCKPLTQNEALEKAQNFVGSKWAKKLTFDSKVTSKIGQYYQFKLPHDLKDFDNKQIIGKVRIDADSGRVIYYSIDERHGTNYAATIHKSAGTPKGLEETIAKKRAGEIITAAGFDTARFRVKEYSQKSFNQRLSYVQYREWMIDPALGEIELPKSIGVYFDALTGELTAFTYDNKPVIIPLDKPTITRDEAIKKAKDEANAMPYVGVKNENVEAHLAVWNNWTKDPKRQCLTWEVTIQTKCCSGQYMDYHVNAYTGEVYEKWDCGCR